jgi:hypothetical protein
MKSLSKSALVSLIAGMAIASTPVEVLLPVDNVFVPNGFDSNDNSEVIITGLLPNLCHKNAQAKVRMLDGGNIDIQVKGMKYDSSNPYCPEMVVPFMEKVELGVLNKGLYNITVNGKSIFEYQSQIEIAESSSNSIDEDVYARVDRVDQDDSRVVVLKGYNPSDCYELDEIKVLDNKKDVYSVLPKMKKVSSFCPMKMMPFAYEFEVPAKLKADRVLIHVRAMDGNSVNSLFSNKDRQ